MNINHPGSGLSRTCFMVRNYGWLTASLSLSLLAAGGAEPAPKINLERPSNVSLRHEVERAIDKGLAWLTANQNTNGFWSSPDHPALTALALDAFLLHGNDDKEQPSAVKKGLAYVMSCVQPDGGIYKKDLPSYNTSVSVVSLVLANRPEYTPAILKARKFIIDLQMPESADTNNPFAGGIGYAKSDRRPDLSNSSWAYEAVRLTGNYVKDRNLSEAGDLNWAAAVKFIQACQNLPAYNSQSWVSDNPQDKGGFIYTPTHSMAGETNLPSGKVALRSYGSMSYAGLLSYIYAELKLDDPRVKAVQEWLRVNYTVDENPAMGRQGVYYYYVVMAKALALSGADTFQTKDGRTVVWREDLALKLINLQHTDGSWVNDDARWWEKDPALVTAFTLITMDILQKKL